MDPSGFGRSRVAVLVALMIASHTLVATYTLVVVHRRCVNGWRDECSRLGMARLVAGGIFCGTLMAIDGLVRLCC